MMKIKGCHAFCTQLSPVGANKASLTLSVQQIFGNDIRLSFSPLPHMKGILCSVQEPSIRAANGKKRGCC